MVVTTTHHNQWQKHPANEPLCVCVAYTCQARFSAVCRITSGPRGLHFSVQMLLNLLLTAGCW